MEERWIHFFTWTHPVTADIMFRAALKQCRRSILIGWLKASVCSTGIPIVSKLGRHLQA